MSQTAAQVFKGERPAATLRRTEAGVEFAYTDEYLESPGPAVASSLPVQEQPVITPAGAVPAFFANLLPEGRRLTALRRAVKTSADDELSLLLAVGGDPVGDVSVRAGSESVTNPAPPPVEVGTAWSDVDFRELMAASAMDPSALAGVQEKVSGRMITLPLVHGGRAHLLKIAPPEYPRAVENEAHFLTMARALRQPVVDADVVHDKHGVSGLLIRRFDRAVDVHGQLRRLPVEDGAQLLNIYPADKYNVSFESLMTAVADACASRPLAVRALVVQLAFAWLTGNGDLHAKNVSVTGGEGVWSPAPIYDIPSTVPYGDHTLALPVAGSTSGLSRKRLLEVASGLGLTAAAAERAIDEAVAAVDMTTVDAGGIGFDPRRRRDLDRVMRQRRRTLTT